MQTPAVTVQELLNENRRLREAYAAERKALTVELRDQFAMAALPAVLDVETTASGEIGRTTYSPDTVAHLSYELADAMLKARARR